MLQQLVAAIRAAYIAYMMSSRHLVDKPLSTYHHPVADQLFTQLSSSTSGIFVHWGVYESGKSTAAKQAAWRLQEEAGRTVILLDGFNFICLGKPIREQFKFLVGVSETSSEPVATFYSKPTTVIIDNFDVLMYEKRECEALEFLQELSAESVETQKFNVLLILTPWEQAVQLREKGYTVIAPSAKWSEEQLHALFSTLPESLQNKWKDENSKSELLRLAAISGTPGDLLFGVRGEKVSEKRAWLLAEEWRKGGKALDESCATKEKMEEEGRFPDKNGIFHWEDLAKMAK